jgi:hypothetical protein
VTQTHTILLKLNGALPDDGVLAAALKQVAARSALDVSDLHAHVLSTRDELYAYLELREAQELTAADAARVGETALALPAFAGLADLTIEAARLTRMFEAPGASSGERAPFHYIVETDAADGWLDEMMRWYDTEHMPGLAAVPGNVRAQRYLNQDGGPRSLACYDLVTPDTLGSPPWLAVRHTAWSDRVRPNFRNTKRTMFSTLPEIAL